MRARLLNVFKFGPPTPAPKRSATFAILLLLLHWGPAEVARCTDVGGIINNDMTWTLAGSPYNLKTEVQVARGITLTIQPGVVVNGHPVVNESSNHITLFGNLNAVGTSNAQIFL